MKVTENLSVFKELNEYVVLYIAEGILSYF